VPFGIDLADEHTRRVLAFAVVGFVLVCFGSAMALVILAITSTEDR